VLTAASLDALPQCSEVISVAITATKFEFRALGCRWIVAPSGEQRPAVSSHGWQMAHVLWRTHKATHLDTATGKMYFKMCLMRIIRKFFSDAKSCGTVTQVSVDR
jgi:hypothetical protein